MLLWTHIQREPNMDINERINQFCQNLNALYVEEYAKRAPNLMSPTFAPEYGKKYVRIVEHAAKTVCVDGRSVYCFIDLSNGDILKAAGWRAPAKGKRGSIFNEDCDVGPNKPANMHGSGLYR